MKYLALTRGISRKGFLFIWLFSLIAVLFGCQNPSDSLDEDDGQNGLVTAGTEIYRDFIVDNVYHSKDSGDIHFSLYVLKSYDGSKPYALYLALCGYGGYYFQGAGINLRRESFAFEAQKYNSEMIIVAPQLTDWGNPSANQTIALTEYFLQSYNIDLSKVFISGYSGGGETVSLVMEKRPGLFTGVLHISSVWDGRLQPLAECRTPVYFVIGDKDEYYGSARIRETYEILCGLYREHGLSDAEIGGLAVLDIKNEAYFAGYGVSNQHAGGAFTAFDEEIMGWLFHRQEG